MRDELHDRVTALVRTFTAADTSSATGPNSNEPPAPHRDQLTEIIDRYPEQTARPSKPGRNKPSPVRAAVRAPEGSAALRRFRSTRPTMRAELAVAAAVMLVVNAGARRRLAWPVLPGQRRCGPDRCDHVEDRLTGRGRVVLFREEFLMARAVDDSVRAVGRHGGEADLRSDAAAASPLFDGGVARVLEVPAGDQTARVARVRARASSAVKSAGWVMQPRWPPGRSITGRSSRLPSSMAASRHG